MRPSIATDWSGAAAFGARGAAAVTGEVVEVVCTPPRRIETFAAEHALADAYAERLPNWRKFYRPRR
jgi:xylulokinase